MWVYRDHRPNESVCMHHKHNRGCCPVRDFVLSGSHAELEIQEPWHHERLEGRLRRNSYLLQIVQCRMQWGGGISIERDGAGCTSEEQSTLDWEACSTEGVTRSTTKQSKITIALPCPAVTDEPEKPATNCLFGTSSNSSFTNLYIWMSQDFFGTWKVERNSG